MRIDKLDGYYVVMPLIYPWRTAYGEDRDIHSVLVKATSGEWEAWSESTPFFAPTYLTESAGSVFYHVSEVFGPYVVGREYETAADLNDRLDVFKGNSFAKAAIEIGWWALASRISGTPLHRLLGGRTREVVAGADFGIQDSFDMLLGNIQQAVDAGFPRIKLKVAKGWDLDMLQVVRKAFPGFTFHIDCNSGYTLEDLPFFKAIDGLGLAFIEQPLHFADVLDHAELARQIATFQPELLILIDHSENQLFFFEEEFQHKFAAQPVVAEVRDITNYASISNAMDKYLPHVIFHAAAYKHVPLMERVPDEAIRNNVLGTYALAKASHEKGAEKFVLISTDKAVNPSSIMGATKRLTELLMQDMDRRSPTRFVAVRFGNVLGSNASVVPIFREQISKGGPVTVTHPEARRYFMTIPEAAQLVMQAGAIGSGGEVFVLDMGEPIRILDMARDLIYLSGHTPDEDIKIIVTGLRPGEKLYEELNFQGEELLPTSHPKLRMLRSSGTPGNMEEEITRLAQELPTMTSAQAWVRLQALVPEYTPAAYQRTIEKQ